MTKRPEIGDVLYSCREHLYYPELSGGGYGSVRTEFLVVEELVVDFFIPPKDSHLHKAVITVGNIQGDGKLSDTPRAYHGRTFPKSGGTPTHWKFSDIGKRIFYSPEEAAMIAQKKSDCEDEVWNLRYGNPPCKRSMWEHYLPKEKLSE